MVSLILRLIRLEQLYPFPDKELDAILAEYTQLKDAVWCQEEPMNQGAWYSSQHHMRNAIQRLDPKATVVSYAGRSASAAPASGYMSVHLEEQKQVY